MIREYESIGSNVIPHMIQTFLLLRASIFATIFQSLGSPEHIQIYSCLNGCDSNYYSRTRHCSVRVHTIPTLESSSHIERFRDRTSTSLSMTTTARAKKRLERCQPTSLI